jgi:hypothetical protein
MHLFNAKNLQLAWRTTLFGTALATGLCPLAQAQGAPAPTNLTTQDPSMVFRSGLWKQWIYWAIPGPHAYAAIQRIVAEVNAARASAGLPLLVSNPSYEIVVSVFDEKNARGANGSSALPTTSNQEAFLATFVDDAAGGSEVLFLTDSLRSNDLLAVKGVPGVSAQVEREIEIKSQHGEERVETEWRFSSVAGDRIEFSAHYPSSAIYYHSVTPAARIDYAKFNLGHSADLIYRSAPTQIYPLFARDEGNFIDLTAKGVHAKVRIEHHDPDVNAIFNDPRNLPEVLIASDRDVRIERR